MTIGETRTFRQFSPPRNAYFGLVGYVFLVVACLFMVFRDPGPNVLHSLKTAAMFVGILTLMFGVPVGLNFWNATVILEYDRTHGTVRVRHGKRHVERSLNPFSSVEMRCEERRGFRGHPYTVYPVVLVDSKDSFVHSEATDPTKAALDAQELATFLGLPCSGSLLR